MLLLATRGLCHSYLHSPQRAKAEIQQALSYAEDIVETVRNPTGIVGLIQFVGL
jgi:hypothetical protein